jgi:hypothetical protein
MMDSIVWYATVGMKKVGKFRTLGVSAGEKWVELFYLLTLIL